MTEAAIRVERDGLINASLDIDLSRSMATTQDYFNLMSSLNKSHSLPLCQRIAHAIRVENDGRRVPVFLVLAFSVN